MYKSILSLAKSQYRHDWQALKKLKPYKFPWDYPDWDTLSAIAVLCRSSLYTSIGELIEPGDLLARSWGNWIAKDLPAYCISSELLKAFWDTDTESLPRLIPDNWLPPLYNFLLVFPKSTVVTVEGHDIAFLQVVIRHPSQPQIDMRLSYASPFTVCVSLLDSGLNAWHNYRSVEGLTWDEGITPVETTDAESELLDRLLGVALQSVLAMSYMPELIENPPKRVSSHKKNKKTSPRFLYPRWLGKDFKRQAGGDRQSLGGTHSSPVSHWRRGHWRQQACGTQRSDRRMIWIQPCYISSSQQP